MRAYNRSQQELSSHFSTKTKIAEASTAAIPNFITLLRSKNPNVLRNTMAAVSELVFYLEKVQEQFCTPDVAASFVNLVHSSDFWISYNTLSVLDILLKKKSLPKRRELYRDMKLEAALSHSLNVTNPDANQKRSKELAQRIQSYLKDIKK
eukprot:TRINITY_DN5080_c0_g1_i2.p1 TRINITY_DN5080_c0_g1~~TRINITY_DN5080_c0_g1_i2.p1  ORF type:complete len:151 (-),score=39.89 TRINITY_DN5080_c0_g1_i2:32-484(-)